VALKDRLRRLESGGACPECSEIRGTVEYAWERPDTPALSERCSRCGRLTTVVVKWGDDALRIWEGAGRE